MHADAEVEQYLSLHFTVFALGKNILVGAVVDIPKIEF